MAKNKIQLPKISPALCIKNLSDYHESVFLLVHSIDLVLDQLPEKFQPMVKDNIDKVKEFYTTA